MKTGSPLDKGVRCWRRGHPQEMKRGWGAKGDGIGCPPGGGKGGGGVYLRGVG